METNISEMNIHIEEYKCLRNEILNRVDFQQRILNYQIILLGIIITASLSISNLSPSAFNSISIRYFLLLAPFPFYFLSWSFSNHDIIIAALARYINLDLRPRIMKLVEDKDVLRLEEFLKQERDKRAIKFGIFPTLGEEYLFPLVLPLILILTYVFLFFYKDYYRILGAHGVPQYIILFINLVFLFKTIQLRIKASKNYSRVIKL